MSQTINPEILAFIDHLAEVGSHYRIEEMEPLYVEELSLLALTPDGGVMRIDKARMLEEFRARRDAGEPPMSTEKRVLHVEERGDEATALLYRRMSEESPALFHELRLKKTMNDWQVTGETIAPWPDLSSSQGFCRPGRADASTSPPSSRPLTRPRSPKTSPHRCSAQRNLECGRRSTVARADLGSTLW